MDTSLFTDTERFFQQRSENPGLFRPLGIVFLAAVFSIGGGLLLYQALSTELPIVFLVIQAGGIILSVIVTFILWVILAVVFYLISIAVDGEGSLGDTFKLIGWGFVPQIIGGIITTIAYYIALQAVEVPSFPDNINLQNEAQIRAIGRALSEFTVAVTTHPAVRVAAVFGIFILVWQLVIWVFAMKSARDLTTRGAIITVGIPVGLYILYQTYALLSGWVI